MFVLENIIKSVLVISMRMRLIVSFLFLFMFGSFLAVMQWNALNSIPDNLYNSFQKDSEALVLSYITESNREDGNANGFIGKYNVPKTLRIGLIPYQYIVFKTQAPGDFSYLKYLSSAGWQGLVYAHLYDLAHKLGISGDGNPVAASPELSFMRIITAALMAAMLASLILMLGFEFGIIAGIFVFIGTLFNPSFMVMGNNLYWMPFLMVAPLLFSWFLLSKNITNKWVLPAGMYALFFIKSMMGYEFLSTIILAAMSPVIYFSIKNRRGFAYFVKNCFVIGVSGVLGFVSALGIHLYKLHSLNSSWSDAWALFIAVVAKRTHGNPEYMEKVYRVASDASSFDVLRSYMHTPVFYYPAAFSLSISDLLIGLCFFALIVGTYIFINNQHLKTKFIALLAIVVWSFVAVASWHVLAKGHSFFHHHINNFLWGLPLSIFIYVFFGYYAQKACSLIKTKYEFPSRNILYYFSN